jgi:hypothetical protein
VSVAELFRYLAQATPLWVLLATVGLLVIAPRRPGLASLLWVACLLPPVPELAELVSGHRPGDDPRVAALPRLGLVDGDLQREVRATLAALDANPVCALRTRGRRWGSSPQRPVVEDVQLEAGERGPLLERAAPGALPRPDARCTLVLVPLDCGLAGRQVDCGGLVPPGATRVASERFAAAPWVYADHTGGWEGSTQAFELWLSRPDLVTGAP